MDEAFERRGEEEGFCTEIVRRLRSEPPETARALLIRSLDRLRGALELHFGAQLEGAAREEIVARAAEATRLELQEREPDRSDPCFHAWRIGMQLAADELRRAGSGAHEGDRSASLALEQHTRASVARLEPLHRSILLADLDHGGRAPVGPLAARLGLSIAEVCVQRGAAHEAFLRSET